MADEKEIVGTVPVLPVVIHDEVILEAGKECTWADIEFSLGGIPFPKVNAVAERAYRRLILDRAADTTRENTEKPLGAPATLTEAETLDIQERVRAQLENALGVNLPEGPDGDVGDPRPFDPHGIVPIEYEGPSWRKPQQRRPRSTYMVGTGPVFVGELNICVTHIEVAPSWFPGGDRRLEVRGRMPERDTGKLEDFVFTQGISSYDTKPLRELVREALITFMTHEIEEQIYEVQPDGRETRPFDPHGMFETTIKVNL